MYIYIQNHIDCDIVFYHYLNCKLHLIQHFIHFFSTLVCHVTHLRVRYDMHLGSLC